MKKIERVIHIGKWKEREREKGNKKERQNEKDRKSYKHRQMERERGPREEVKVGVSNDKVGGDSCNI